MVTQAHASSSSPLSSVKSFIFFKSLSVKQNLKKDKSKKQLLYVVIDSSGSMCQQLEGKVASGLVTKASLSVLFSSALAKRIMEDGGILFTRFFDGGVGDLIEAREKDEFERLMFTIARNSFDGGGTDIVKAIQTAVQDVQAAKDELASAEILLLTDCQDAFSAAQAKAAAGKYKINTLDISGRQGHESVKEALKAISAKYYFVDHKQLDISKMVSLVS